ncbi:hypothetical protein C8R47DRAFT_1226068 [Mycena vitilis]|nr:hypothetical protein C8R47DRAFT_1226068 [Mycena vitilis]
MAEYQRARCEMTPSLSVYLRIATLVVEVCASATPKPRRKVRPLAMHAVKCVTGLIDKGTSSPLSLDLQCLNKLESTFDSIRRHIEAIPEQGAKSQKIIAAAKFLLESRHLEHELDAACKALVKRPKEQKAQARGASRTECVLELASIGTRVAGAVCDIPAPGFAFAKPAFAMAALIVKSNRTAAEALAHHAQNVTNSIVRRAGPALQRDSLEELCRALQQVQDFLEVLQSRCPRISWIFAFRDKECFAELNSTLDRALNVFSASENVSATEIARHNAQQLVTLVAAINHIEGDIQRTMPVSCTTFARDYGEC